MPENIIDRLKTKEDEMEALLAEARKKAAAIREEAVRKAAALRAADSGDIEGEAGRLRDEAAKEVEAASVRLMAEAEAEAERAGKTGEQRFEEAVGLIQRLVAEGTDDREDDKGPGNRA